MNQSELFDLSFLEEMDDKSFVAEVVNLYIRDTATDLQEMNVALRSRNLDMVAQMAHKLKSSTGMLQANTLYLILAQTEQDAKEGNPSGELARLVPLAQQAFDVLKTGLEKYLRTSMATASY